MSEHPTPAYVVDEPSTSLMTWGTSSGPETGHSGRESTELVPQVVWALRSAEFWA